MIDPQAPPSSRSGSGKVAVLYVAGPGRSGSTLLDTMLGQLEGVVSVGELRNLWVRGLGEGWPCGCGAAVRECPFWSAVLTEAFGSVDAVSIREMCDLQRRSVRTRHLPSLWWHARRKGTATEGYGAVLGRLYRAIADVSSSRVIVDSSKHPSDAFVISTLGDVRLSLVHLVRDPRGVAYSWSRPKASERESITLESQSIVRCSVRWSVWNAAISNLLSRRVEGRYLLLRYEDLISEPGPAIQRVLDLTGESHQNIPLSGNRIVLGPTHTVCGNPGRFYIGEQTLQSDDRWMHDMAAGDRLKATIPALPLLRKYGYRAHPDLRAARASAR